MLTATWIAALFTGKYTLGDQQLATRSSGKLGSLHTYCIHYYIHDSFFSIIHLFIRSSSYQLHVVQMPNWAV
jgi:hypothetical protein